MVVFFAGLLFWVSWNYKGTSNTVSTPCICCPLYSRLVILSVYEVCCVAVFISVFISGWNDHLMFSWICRPIQWQLFQREKKINVLPRTNVDFGVNTVGKSNSSCTDVWVFRQKWAGMLSEVYHQFVRYCLLGLGRGLDLLKDRCVGFTTLSKQLNTPPLTLSLSSHVENLQRLPPQRKNVEGPLLSQCLVCVFFFL